MGVEPPGADPDPIRVAFVRETPFCTLLLRKGPSSDAQTRKPSRSLARARTVARIRALFDRLAALWSTPRVGRVALCSPLVGVIAGLGAVGFLLALQFMYSAVLGGLLHFHLPPTTEDTPHRN